MDSKNNYLPFDLYDFFGYLMPGFIASMGIVIYIPSLRDFLAKILPLFSKSDSWWIGVVVFSGIVVIVYCIGHLVASLSSLLIEKFFVQKITAYPIDKLMGQDRVNQDSTKDAVKENRKNLFMGFILLLLMRLIHSIIGENVVVFLVVSIICVLLFVILLNKNILLKTFRRVSSSVSTMLSINEDFDNAFKQKFSRAIYKEFRQVKLTRDTYWFCYIHVINSSPNDARLIQHWLRLYSLMRNLSATFLLIFVLHWYYDPTGFDAFCEGLVIILMMFTTFLRYYYIYYNYYSKYLFRSFVMLSEKK